MASKYGSPSKDENNSGNEDDALSPLISVGDSNHCSESEAGDINFDEKAPGSDHRVSSSGSTSDLFQMDMKMLKKSSTFPGGSPESEDSQSPNRREKSDRSSNSQDFHPPSQTMSPVQLPPKQVMERSEVYDPDRIPASVFDNRSSSAMEWSVASNESLFSLNFGSSSFSGEFLMMSGEMSGEDIRKSGELYDSGELSKPGLPPLSPLGKLHKVRTMDADKKPKPTPLKDEDISAQFEKKKRELDGNANSSIINRPSDASAASSQSFAFPILVDTTKYTSVKGPFPRKQDPKPDVYTESPQMKTHKKKSSSQWRWCCFCCYCCWLPECSCPSYRHCWSWKSCKKWCCCCCCCCYYCCR